MWPRGWVQDQARKCGRSHFLATTAMAPAVPRVSPGQRFRDGAGTHFWCHLKVLGNALVCRPRPGRPVTQRGRSASEARCEAPNRQPLCPTGRCPGQVTAAVPLAVT